MTSPLAVHQTVGDFFPCALIDLRDRGAGDLHAFGALLMRHFFKIDQPDNLKFIHCQFNCLRVLYRIRRKLRIDRFLAILRLLCGLAGPAPLPGICRL